MGYFNGATTSTYKLNPKDPTFTFGPKSSEDVTTASLNGVYGESSVNWNVTNYGSITGDSAVVFEGNGTFDNTKSGKVSNIVGANWGVHIKGVGTVINAGSITGAYDVSHTDSQGVELDSGGSVTNAKSGVIDGNVVLGGAGAITNAGSITNAGEHFAVVALNDGGRVNNTGGIKLSGQYGSGVYVKLGGTVTNHGKISDTSSSSERISGIQLVGTASATNFGAIDFALYGHASAINIGSGGAKAVNAGKITINATEYVSGMYSAAGGSITNTGTITINVTQHAAGMELKDGGTATNAGKISVVASSAHTAGVDLAAGGTFTNSGSVYAAAPAHTTAVDLTSGGTVINKAGGSIVDKTEAGIYAGGSAGVTITNAGKISGGEAIHFSNAGTSSDAITNTLTLNTGSKLTGGVVGSTGPFVTNDLTLEGKGSASNPISDFQNLTVDKHAVWTLGGADVFSNAITDQGSLTVSSAGALGGPLTIDSGGLAIFDSAYDGDVTFAGKGELELTDTYTGTIGGLAGHDSIDFLSDKFAKGDKVSVTDDVLTIASSSNSPIVSITLSSSLPASDFTLGADTSGHLLLKFT